MMKKMLTIATAALALSACGSSAPEVVEVKPDAEQVIDTSILSAAWDTQTPEQQHLMCGHWTKTPTMVIDLILSDTPVTSRDAVANHFNSVCGIK